MSEPTPQHVLNSLWEMTGQPQGILSQLALRADHSLPSLFHVGPVASATISAQALMAAQIWGDRTGQMQTVEVDQRHALACFRSERYLHVDGIANGESHDDLHGFYQTANRQWVQLHTAFPHHREGVLRILGCEPSREAVSAALQRWQAEQLESQLAEAGLVGSAVRTTDQWQRHPQSGALSGLPLFEIQRIGDAPAEPVGRGVDPTQPLSGVRVLDLSRVIAAPVAGRTLAQHGANVLAISAPHLPQVQALLIDTGRGKRQAFLDLRQTQERDQLLELVRQGDVFIQAFRPGGLTQKGMGPEALARVRPGIIYVTLSAYGHTGPWAMRRGYDSLVQSATGIAHAEGMAAGLSGPGKLPCQALDYASGYLAAMGAMVALRRRATEGGSWLVRVSLAQTARWLRQLGERENGLLEPELTLDEVRPWLQTMQTPFGEVAAVAPAEQMAATPARFNQVCVPCGTHEPEW
ncbi:CoA transferase [Orrella marina]|uniref:Carnitine dehydratase n=1 Tax=Orrella marina TaxID=2163011 RepID=A0A2R4XKX2_9BURK|nr:CoA transferase [Orrella marina]AWB34447.1 carnitine dehydratase [Orrella marina]